MQVTPNNPTISTFFTEPPQGHPLFILNFDGSVRDVRYYGTPLDDEETTKNWETLSLSEKESLLTESDVNAHRAKLIDRITSLTKRLKELNNQITSQAKYDKTYRTQFNKENDNFTKYCERTKQTPYKEFLGNTITDRYQLPLSSLECPFDVRQTYMKIQGIYGKWLFASNRLTELEQSLCDVRNELRTLPSLESLEDDAIVTSDLIRKKDEEALS